MFYADLHIHSRFSRATGRDADLEHMAIWARKKGVAVLGTGDFTHPEWFREIRDKLVPAEPSLFRLRDDLQREVDRQVDNACQGVTRFLLEVEISTIYKQGDRTRKVHHLIYVPDLEAAKRLIARLSRIGNLRSDGRPILGLDSRHLLEITLESSPDSYLVPAHIWTPWFAVLGSKSGFDAIEECYGDLTQHVFAVETGLSSDPPMNWWLSQLDRFTLVSNSDAHSPAKIGREACAFTCAMDYFSIRKALETRIGYAGTVEFFPEEGKYHLDGHGACDVRLTPAQSRRLRDRCPVCGGELTIGVLHRVDELADRPKSFRAPHPQPFRSLVPLPELLGEIFGVGPATKRVQTAYDESLAKLGPELFILEQAPLADITRAGSLLLAEAIQRMRSGRVHREPGFDGEYGTIRMFAPGELARRGQSAVSASRPTTASRRRPLPRAAAPARRVRRTGS
jgi:DNA helicase-2/ATP-dependent DNA helicase PcrA